MTIAIPVDAETERLARKVAEAKGKALEDVVREAIEISAREAGILTGTRQPRGRAEKLAKMRAISERSASRPLLDTRRAEEILAYDEHGLPK